VKAAAVVVVVELGARWPLKKDKEGVAVVGAAEEQVVAVVVVEEVAVGTYTVRERPPCSKASSTKAKSLNRE